MSIFDHSDYRSFLTASFSDTGGKSRGKVTAIAKLLRVHTTFVSLVFKGSRELSLEHAVQLGAYLALNQLEMEYFVYLLIHSKSGSLGLTTHAQAKLNRLQESVSQKSTKFQEDVRLPAEERAIFYSSWHYSAIRLYVSAGKEGRTISDVSTHFDMNRTQVAEAIQFLVRAKLLLEKEDRYHVGTKRTFLEKKHPLLKSHLTNWRLKALQSFEGMGEEEQMFTSSFSISKKDFLQIKVLLIELKNKVSDLIDHTEAEDVACLNIDFFWVR